MAKSSLIIPEHYIKPRCDSKLGSQATAWKNAHWKRFNNNEPDRWTNMASIKINGKCLCRKHAAIAALDILLEEGVAKDGSV